MKFFIVAIVLLGVCALSVRGDMKATMSECAKKNNVNIDDVKKMWSGDLKGADITQDFKCFSSCLTDADGITKNGVFQADAVTAKLSSHADEAEIAKVIAACKDIKGTDNCDTGHKILACMRENKKKKV